MNLSSITALLVACPITVVGCSPGGGCYWHQTHFQVSPPESCVQTNYDVCNASHWVTVINSCTQNVVITYSQTDSGISNVTIAPGTKQLINTSPFATTGPNGWHIQIPATLGTTSIVISYDVT
jgi:hypothetical protein